MRAPHPALRELYRQAAMPSEVLARLQRNDEALARLEVELVAGGAGGDELLVRLTRGLQLGELLEGTLARLNAPAAPEEASPPRWHGEGVGFAEVPENAPRSRGVGLDVALNDRGDEARSPAPLSPLGTTSGVHAHPRPPVQRVPPAVNLTAAVERALEDRAERADRNARPAGETGSRPTGEAGPRAARDERPGMPRVAAPGPHPIARGTSLRDAVAAPERGRRAEGTGDAAGVRQPGPRRLADPRPAAPAEPLPFPAPALASETARASGATTAPPHPPRRSAGDTALLPRLDAAAANEALVKRATRGGVIQALHQPVGRDVPSRVHVVLQQSVADAAHAAPRPPQRQEIESSASPEPLQRVAATVDHIERATSHRAATRAVQTSRGRAATPPVQTSRGRAAAPSPAPPKPDNIAEPLAGPPLGRDAQPPLASPVGGFRGLVALAESQRAESAPPPIPATAPAAPPTPSLDDATLTARISEILRRDAERHGIDLTGVEP